jgi:hypothetical protein
VTVRTLTTLVAVAVAVAAFVVSTILFSGGDPYAILFAGTAGTVGVLLGLWGSRRFVLPEQGRLTVRELRERRRDGTLPPPRPEEVRRFRRLMLAAHACTVPAVALAWLEFGRVAGVVLAALLVSSSVSGWIVDRKLRRRLLRR